MSWAGPDRTSIDAMDRERRAKMQAYRAELSAPIYQVADLIRLHEMSPDDAALLVEGLAARLTLSTADLLAWVREKRVEVST